MEGATDFGPQPPAETMGLKVDNKEESELKASIKKKGQNSYYYAHNYDGQNFNDENAKKFYGDGLIYGGEPTLVAKNESRLADKKALEKKAIKIQKYSFLDEDTKVKVYIEFSQFGSAICKEMIDIQFNAFSVDVRIVEADGTENILNIKPLYEKIETENCSWRYSEKKISITLKKWLETSWLTLTKQPK